MASSLAKVADVPVNLYRGTPEISVPIYAVKGRTLSTDITLEYINPSGIKIHDIAGPAGLGWSLTGGGVITRTVRGLPDENPQYGYCMANKAGIHNDVSSVQFDNAATTLVENDDLDPDVFNSSVGGRIVFSYTKQPIFTEDQGFVIKKNGLFAADSTWEIIDTKGNRYLFGKNAIEREHTISSGTGVVEQKFISSW